MDMDRESVQPSLLDIYQATAMVLSGRPSRPVDTLFFHGRSYGDYTGLFELTRDLVDSRLVRTVLLFGNEGQRVGSDIPFQSNPGRTWCRQQLIANGVSEGVIFDAPLGGYHTRWESNDFLTVCIQNDWTSGVILTQPHQLLRAMLGMVKAMQERAYMMAVYTAAPTNTPWQEVVRGNQGMELKRREDHISDELMRIPRYQAAGDLASFQELFGYLAMRDNGKLVLGSAERGRELFFRDP